MAGYRKLLAFAFLALCATVLQILGRFDPTIATFLGSIYGGLVVGNWREHAAQATARAGVAPGPARPGDPAPFAAREPSDDTAFDPQRPAVDQDTMITMLADMMAERVSANAPRKRAP